MLRAQLNTVSNFLSDATTPESVFIVPTHDILSDKMCCDDAKENIQRKENI